MSDCEPRWEPQLIGEYRHGRWIGRRALDTQASLTPAPT